MRADRKARALGVALAAAAVPVFLLVEAPLGLALAFSLAATGLFVAIIVAERTVPAPAAEALLRGGAAVLADTSRGLKLGARGIYVPDQGNVGEERLFLPASDDDRPLPVLDADTVIYAGTGATKLGLACRPPGLALVAEHAASSGKDLRGVPLPEAEAFLASLGSVHDLLRQPSLVAGSDGIQVRFAAAAAEPPCFLEPTDPACVRTGCALCQAVGVTLVRSIGKPLAFERADVSPPWVTLHVRLAGGSVAPVAGEETEQ